MQFLMEQYIDRLVLVHEEKGINTIGYGEQAEQKDDGAVTFQFNPRQVIVDWNKKLIDVQVNAGCEADACRDGCVLSDMQGDGIVVPPFYMTEVINQVPEQGLTDRNKHKDLCDVKEMPGGIAGSIFGEEINLWVVRGAKQKVNHQIGKTIAQKHGHVHSTIINISVTKGNPNGFYHKTQKGCQQTNHT